MRKQGSGTKQRWMRGVVQQCGSLVTTMILGFAFFGTAMAQQAPGEQQVNFQIAAGPLKPALDAFSAASGVTITVPDELTQDQRSEGVTGTMAPAQALQRLLTGTGLSFSFTSPTAVSLVAGREGERTTLPGVTVSADRQPETARSPVPGYTATRSATATKTDTPIAEIPQAITVVTADQIKDQGSPTMQEVLRYTPGVRNEQYGVDNRGDYFTMRGGSENATVLDGLKLPMAGYWGFVRNEPYAFDRIEVLRGATSLLYGQTAYGPGGVVNLVSKLPLATPHHEVAAQLGNYEHKQVMADTTGPLTDDGTWHYRLVTLVKRSGTQVEHAYEERELFFPSVMWQPNSGLSLTAYFQYQRDESDNLNAFLPIEGTLKPGPNGRRISDSLYIGEPDWDTYGGYRRRVGYLLEKTLSDTWTLRHNFRHDDVSGHMKTMYVGWFDGYFADNETMNRYLYANRYEQDITTADLTFVGKFSSGNLQHTVLVGSDWFASDEDLQQAEELVAPINLYDPEYDLIDNPSPAYGAKEWTKISQTGVFVQDQVKIGSHYVVVAGLRYDQTKEEYSATAYEAAKETSDSAISKQLGAMYLASNGWSPYVSYSESFDAVPGRDRHGDAFKPSRGQQYEFGVKHSPANKRTSFAAAIYNLKETGRLSEDSVDPAFSVQRGEVTVNGLELDANARLQSWDLIANYTYTDAKLTSTSVKDDPGLDKQFQGIPYHMANTWAVYKFAIGSTAGYRAGGGVRYIGETSDGTDTTTVPAVTLFDAMASFEDLHWRYALNISNLTDESYIATCLTRGDCWFGSRRKIVGTAAYNW